MAGCSGEGNGEQHVCASIKAYRHTFQEVHVVCMSVCPRMVIVIAFGGGGREIPRISPPPPDKSDKSENFENLGFRENFLWKFATVPDLLAFLFSQGVCKGPSA